MLDNNWNKLKSEFINPYCKRVVRPPFDAEDRAFEILTTVYLRAKGLSPSELNISWLNRTVSGEVKKTFRKRKLQTETLESEPSDGSSSVLDEVCQMEEINTLRAFLPKLSEKQRQCLYTRFPVAGCEPTESEVAERFGIK